MIDNSHDKVLIPFKSGVGGHAVKEFEHYLNEDGERIINENDYELSHYQYDNYTMLDVLNIEYMSNAEIASYQWYCDNPGWWGI